MMRKLKDGTQPLLGGRVGRPTQWPPPREGAWRGTVLRGSQQWMHPPERQTDADLTCPQRHRELPSSRPGAVHSAQRHGDGARGVQPSKTVCAVCAARGDAEPHAPTSPAHIPRVGGGCRGPQDSQPPPLGLCASHHERPLSWAPMGQQMPSTGGHAWGRGGGWAGEAQSRPFPGSPSPDPVLATPPGSSVSPSAGCGRDQAHQMALWPPHA